MKLTSRKLLGFLVTIGALIFVFLMILFFAKEYLNVAVIPIVSGLVGASGILTTGIAIDKKTISENYRPELDK